MEHESGLQDQNPNKRVENTTNSAKRVYCKRPKPLQDKQNEPRRKTKRVSCEHFGELPVFVK